MAYLARMLLVAMAAAFLTTSVTFAQNAPPQPAASAAPKPKPKKSSNKCKQQPQGCQNKKKKQAKGQAPAAGGMAPASPPA
ncbi:MAG TPA: hypothetical protein VGX91_03960 [Candidatus Cybelea sp.]|jgi:hypothetical protein|nr:hypothetical protein [Candidatus Cybelea sp.]